MNGPIFSFLEPRQQDLGPAAGDEPSPYRHWRLGRDDRDIAWLLFDQADSHTNTLGEEQLGELGRALEQLARQPPRALLLRSAKASDFCAGADIRQFRQLKQEAEIVERLRAAHAVADRLAGLDFPTLALIHGNCLGGGLELALCCNYRLALPDARLGLPEIRLGLHPGLGGTARLPQRIDPVQAMTLMLTGKTLDARRARKAGLVDDVIEERHLRGALDALLSGELQQQDSGLKEQLLTSKAARHLEARQMRAKAAKKADPDHYPAPEALIRLWQDHGGDFEAMRKAEMRSFARLLTTDTAQNLIRVFFLQEQMKRTARNDAPPVERVHVIGAGTMGGDIAAWCALKGLRVSLFDPEARSLASAVKRAARLCQDKHLDEGRTRAVLDRLIPDPGNYGIDQADLVIEAVPEKVDLKRKIYEEVEPRLKPGALLATNTSSIPLEELQQSLKQPDRFLGLHFFNPVAKMPLVEVVAPEGAADATQARGRAFVGRIGRQPAPVASAPGFLVNRALMPYLLEAVTLMEEGVSPETLDQAAEKFGMPMGPVELADQVGLDICLSVAEMLRERLEGPMAPIPERLRQRVSQGDLGRKSGHGFYRWEEGKPEKSDGATLDTGNDQDRRQLRALQDRLLLPLLNACMACRREGVIGDDDLLDGAVIFGTGFAPFRGGPLHYAKKRGYGEIAEALNELANRHGERFTPDPGWYDPPGSAPAGDPTGSAGP